MMPDELAAYIRSQDLELRGYYGFDAECVRLHPKDASTLDASTVCALASRRHGPTMP